MASTIDPKTGLPITNQAIPTSALSTPQTPLQVPTPVDLTPTYAATIANASAQAGNDVTTAQTNVDLANQEYKAQGDAYSTLLSKSLGKEADTKQAYNQTGATELLNQVNDFKIQTDNLAREATATPLRTGQAYQGSSGTQGGIDSVNRDLLQRNALQALTVAQASAITQGKYDRAKQLADEYITNKYAGDEARLKAIEVNMSVLDKTKLTPAQEKLKAATLAKNEKDKQVLADKQAAEKAVSDMLIEASPVAPPDVMARAKAVQARGGTAAEVALALGQYGGDYLKNLAYKSQLETDKAQRANIYDQIAVRNGELLLKKTEAADKKALLNFQAPPILNVTTGKIDPKSALASVIKSTGGKLKGGQSALDVLSSVQGLAERNPKGTFEGVGFGGGAVPERFKTQTSISNRQDIEAIGLKVQQWASGASLTEQQTKMVDKFTPQLGDSDNAVKTKINGLVNFMMGQVSSDLVGQGINYSPEPIDMFSGIQSVDNKTFLGGIPSAPSDTTKLFDNKTYFNR